MRRETAHFIGGILPRASSLGRLIHLGGLPPALGCFEMFLRDHLKDVIQDGT